MVPFFKNNFLFHKKKTLKTCLNTNRKKEKKFSEKSVKLKLKVNWLNSINVKLERVGDGGLSLSMPRHHHKK